jgi:ubiquinone/menaquinone biosynthesis C-methylase UbiE
VLVAFEHHYVDIGVVTRDVPDAGAKAWVRETCRMPYDRDVQAFDDRAASYESGRHGRLHKEISDRVVELALSRVPGPRSVLDVGCGTGYVLRQLAARLPGAGEFLGVDAAPKMVEVARSSSSDERLNFVRGTAEGLPADDNAYDLVVSTTSFDHWADQAAGIRECARVLAPGGTLVLTDQFSNLLWPTLLGSRRGKARTRSRATRLITAAGLREPRWHPCYAVIIQSVTAVK